MRGSYLLVASCLVASACAPAVFSQNIGPSHKVKPGMTATEARTILGSPVETVSLSGVDEWRYCATRDESSVVVVFYLQNDVVIDKSTYTFENTQGRFAPECTSRLARLYTDKRSPPARVQKLRGQR